MTVVPIRHLAAGLVAAAVGTGALCIAAPEAAAQFGSIFGDPPPRPPSDVPRGRPPGGQPFPQQQFPQDQQFPQRQPPGPPPRASRPPAGVQTEPLPPPPSGVPGAQQSGLPQPPPGLPPGVRQPRGTPQPANTAPQAGDEVVLTPASQKIANQSAVFSGLDKITGRIISFDVALGETVQFGALQVMPRACYTRPPTEAANTDAFIEVSEVTLQGEVRRLFAGWMFASSPGLHGVEHPIYDIWLTDCKQPAIKVAEEPAPAPPPPPQAAAPAPAPRQPQAPRPRPAAQQQQPPQQSQQPSNAQRAFPTPIR